MSEDQMLQEEISQLVQMLRAGASEDRRRAAIQLGRLGVRTRGVVPQRGSISSSQASEFPGDYQSYLGAAKAAFQDARPDVRREVAFALSEWGDEAAVDMLQWIVLPDEEHAADPDASVRTAVARALGRIGGPKAVEALRRVAVDDPHEEPRSAAVSSLASLALHEVQAKGQAPPVPSGGRIRGAVRTRGASPLRSLSQEATKIMELLEQVRGTDPSWYVREKANEALADLGE